MDATQCRRCHGGLLGVPDSHGEQSMLVKRFHADAVGWQMRVGRENREEDEAGLAQGWAICESHVRVFR